MSFGLLFLCACLVKQVSACGRLLRLGGGLERYQLRDRFRLDCFRRYALRVIIRRVAIVECFRCGRCLLFDGLLLVQQWHWFMRWGSHFDRFRHGDVFVFFAEVICIEKQAEPAALLAVNLGWRRTWRPGLVHAEEWTMMHWQTLLWDARVRICNHFRARHHEIGMISCLRQQSRIYANGRVLLG